MLYLIRHKLVAGGNLTDEPKLMAHMTRQGHSAYETIITEEPLRLCRSSPGSYIPIFITIRALAFHGLKDHHYNHHHTHQY